jgi:hypothetical protein
MPYESGKYLLNSIVCEGHTTEIEFAEDGKRQGNQFGRFRCPGILDLILAPSRHSGRQTRPEKR